MRRRIAPLIALVLSSFGCADGGSGAPDGSTPGDDGGGDTQICSCPCQQIEVPTTEHCWTTSCVPYCGPGSGNAC